MIRSRNLVFGLALVLGMSACGQGNRHSAQPDSSAIDVLINAKGDTPASQVPGLQGLSEDQKKSLEQDSKDLRGDIRQTQSELKANEDVLGQSPDKKDELAARIDALKQRLADLRKAYSEKRISLEEGQGYRDLLQFAIDHNVTALSQLPEKFEEAIIEQQKKMDELKAQEEPLLQKIEASVQSMIEASRVLHRSEKALRDQQALLKAKEAKSAEEQAQLVAIASYLEGTKKLGMAQSERTAAEASVAVHKSEAMESQKLRENLLMQKSGLIAELIRLPANQYQQRELIVAQISQIQDDLIDADLAFEEHQTEVGIYQARQIDAEKNIQAIKVTIDGLIPGLSELVKIDLAAETKSADETEAAFTGLQAEYQSWSDNVDAAEISLARIGSLEAFFAQKFPDVANPQDPETAKN